MVIKTKRMTCLGYAAYMREMKNAYIFVRKSRENTISPIWA
jgi:Tfp pilus assembly protein PilZ